MFDWITNIRRKRRRKDRDDWMVLFLLVVAVASKALGSEVVIQIPEEQVKDQDGFYRLDYWPPQGIPVPNTTFTPQEVARGVKLTHAQPGMRYDFDLYYSNATINDWATWTATITTVPAPPNNLNITVRSGKLALVTWEPPNSGYSAFKLKVIPLSEPQSSIRNFEVSEEQLPFPLYDLTPGASYQLQLYTVYEKKESDAFISSNFTTRPYAPGRFIVWYRNETTMLVLWQPPYPAGIYSHYRVSIDPPDAVESVLNVEKDGEPPGPAQAAFHGLVPAGLSGAFNTTVLECGEGGWECSVAFNTTVLECDEGGWECSVAFNTTVLECVEGEWECSVAFNTTVLECVEGGWECGCAVHRTADLEDQYASSGALLFVNSARTCEA
ncbi:Fibronectin type III [Trinorchestia longiramus]|nr:Fibronectin type III [Trinorchestia longiramus]